MVAPRGAHWACFERSLSVDGSYGWQRVGPVPGANAAAMADWSQKRVRFDEDLWLIELDVAEPERFIVETGLKGLTGRNASEIRGELFPRGGHPHIGSVGRIEVPRKSGITLGEAAFMQHAERPVHRPSDGLHVRAPASFRLHGDCCPVRFVGRSGPSECRVLR